MQSERKLEDPFPSPLGTEQGIRTECRVRSRVNEQLLIVRSVLYKPKILGANAIWIVRVRLL